MTYKTVDYFSPIPGLLLYSFYEHIFLSKIHCHVYWMEDTDYSLLSDPWKIFLFSLRSVLIINIIASDAKGIQLKVNP